MSGRSHSPVLPRRIQQHRLPCLDNPSGLVADYSQQLVVAVHTTRHGGVVSVLIPFVLAYIVCVWRKMNAAPLTPQELSEDTHQY